MGCRAQPAQSGQHGAGGACRGAAVPPHDVRRNHRHDDVLHARWRVPRRRRSAHAAASRRRDDGADDSFQHRADSSLWRGGRGVRHRGEQQARVGLRHLASPATGVGDPFRAWHGPASGFRGHPLAVQVRSADRRAGNRDEHRRRADAALHRSARTQRGSSGGVHRRLYASCSP